MIPLWLALLLVGATGVACWLIADSVGYWRAMDEVLAREQARIRAARTDFDVAMANLEATCQDIVALHDRHEVERLIRETR